MKKQKVGKTTNENYVVYVIDIKSRPLDPTRRFGHVRKLLKSHKARVVSHKPFTIQLMREATGPTRDYTMGIDPGRENIGVAVRDEENNCVFKAEVETKNKSVTQANRDRKTHRSERRRHRRARQQRRALKAGSQMKKGKKEKLKNKTCLAREVSYPGMKKKVTQKVIKGKEARFNNRKRAKGWITGSARQLLQSHLNIIEEVERFLPVKEIVIERNKFDFQKLEDPEISGSDYQKGRLYGYAKDFDYLFDLQNGRCILCGKKAEEAHHMWERSKGGSDRILNKVDLCHSCHEKVHKDESLRKKLEELVSQKIKTYRVSLLNSIMPELIDKISDHCSQKEIDFKTTTGLLTKFKREYYSLEKTHAEDAFLISLGEEFPERISSSFHVYKYRRFKKKSNNKIMKVGSRKYYYNGKLVAQNRHKAMTQMTESLEEYRLNFIEKNSEKEWNEHFPILEVKPAKRVYSAHKDNLNPGFHPGDIVFYRRVLKLGKVKYEGEGVVKTVKPSQNLVQLTSGKSVDFKYCTYIGGRALVCLE